MLRPSSRERPTTTETRASAAPKKAAAAWARGWVTVGLLSMARVNSLSTHRVRKPFFHTPVTFAGLLRKGCTEGGTFPARPAAKAGQKAEFPPPPPPGLGAAGWAAAGAGGASGWAGGGTGRS